MKKYVHDYSLKELQEIPIKPFITQEITEIVLVPLCPVEFYSPIKVIFCHCGKVLGASNYGDLIPLLKFPFSEANRIDCLPNSNCIRLLFNRHEVYYGI